MSEHITLTRQEHRDVLQYLTTDETISSEDRSFWIDELISFDEIVHSDNEFYHYGVKGMKWGKRTAQFNNAVKKVAKKTKKVASDAVKASVNAANKTSKAIGEAAKKSAEKRETRRTEKKDFQKREAEKKHELNIINAQTDGRIKEQERAKAQEIEYKKDRNKKILLGVAGVAAAAGLTAIAIKNIDKKQNVETAKLSAKSTEKLKKLDLDSLFNQAKLSGNIDLKRQQEQNKATLNTKKVDSKNLATRAKEALTSERFKAATQVKLNAQNLQSLLDLKKSDNETSAMRKQLDTDLKKHLDDNRFNSTNLQNAANERIKMAENRSNTTVAKGVNNNRSKELDNELFKNTLNAITKTNNSSGKGTTTKTTKTTKTTTTKTDSKKDEKIQHSETLDFSFLHYGVVGMKWGKRNTKSAKPAAKKSKNTIENKGPKLTKVDVLLAEARARNKVVMSGDKATKKAVQEAQQEHVGPDRKAMKSARHSVKNIANYTDAEVKALAERHRNITSLKESSEKEILHKAKKTVNYLTYANMATAAAYTLKPNKHLLTANKVINATIKAAQGNLPKEEKKDEKK